MSFQAQSQTGKVDPNMNPNFSADQVLLMKTLDSNFLTTDDEAQQNQIQNNMETYQRGVLPFQNNYLDNGSVSYPRGMTDGSFQATTSSGSGSMSGGFAFIPLLASLAPSLIQSVPEIVGTISNLIKGRGLAPENISFTTCGSGARPPNYYAVQGYGKSYYRNAFNPSVKLIKHLFKGAGYPIGDADIACELSRFYPKDFLKALKSKKGKSKKDSKHKEHTDYTLARPMLKYLMGKGKGELFTPEDYHQLKKLLAQEKDLGLKGAGIRQVFGKVKDWLTNKGIPATQGIVNRLVSSYGPDFMKNVSGWIGHYGDRFSGTIKNPLFSSLVKNGSQILSNQVANIKPDEINSLVNRGYSAIAPNSLQESSNRESGTPETAKPVETAKPETGKGKKKGYGSALLKVNLL